MSGSAYDPIQSFAKYSEEDLALAQQYCLDDTTTKEEARNVRLATLRFVRVLRRFPEFPVSDIPRWLDIVLPGLRQVKAAGADAQPIAPSSSSSNSVGDVVAFAEVLASQAAQPVAEPDKAPSPRRRLLNSDDEHADDEYHPPPGKMTRREAHMYGTRPVCSDCQVNKASGNPYPGRGNLCRSCRARILIPRATRRSELKE